MNIAPVQSNEPLDDDIYSSGTGLYATWTIIALNALIFLFMVLNGINLFKPRTLDIIQWGGNISTLIFGKEWWRLLTSMFLHIGIFHLAVNMYSLYFIGSFLEPLIGRFRFVMAYLCAGIIASLSSVLWHGDTVVSAGASGAIFGLAGVLLVLAVMGLVPRHLRAMLLQSLLIFTGYNIFYGFRTGSGVDNAAHLGGLACGLLIGGIYSFTFRKPSVMKTRLVVASLSLVVAFAVFMILKNGEVPVQDLDYKTGEFYNKEERKQDHDNDKFLRMREHFFILNDMALEAIQPNDTLSEKEMLVRLKKTALKDWVECINLMDETEAFDLTPHQREQRNVMREYANHRVSQVRLMILAAEEQTDKYNRSIDSVEQQIVRVLEGFEEENEPTADPEPKDL